MVPRLVLVIVLLALTAVVVTLISRKQYGRLLLGVVLVVGGFWLLAVRRQAHDVRQTRDASRYQVSSHEADVASTFDTATPDSDLVVAEVSTEDFDDEQQQIQLDLPEWITDPPKKVHGNDCMLVSAGPYTTLDECARKLPNEIRKSTERYVHQQMNTDWSFDDVSDSSVTVEDHEYDEARDFEGLGVMHTRHVLIQFDDDFHANVERSVVRQQIRRRLKVASGSFAGLMLAVAGCFAVLKSKVAHAK